MFEENLFVCLKTICLFEPYDNETVNNEDHCHNLEEGDDDDNEDDLNDTNPNDDDDDDTLSMTTTKA